MNRLLEDGCISEMECGNNFAYILNNNALFLSTDYKVLQSQEDGHFVKCMKLLFNGKTQFYYLTNGAKSLKSMLHSVVDADSFIKIVMSIISEILLVKQNGFLSCQNIDLSFERIFINPSTYKATLVYLPISKGFYPDDATAENELRMNLVKVLNEIPNLSSLKTNEFKEDLANGMLSMKELYDSMKGIKIPKKQVSENTDEEVKGNLKLVTINSPVNVEIKVTKDTFVIGKNARVVDGVVSFNKMISRVHCKITKNDGKYMITDLESANGTYVNRVRQPAGLPCYIKNGDIVRLANSDFEVVIS